VASAAGVGLLALSPPAAAKIVYTKTNQQLPVQLDLNHDGITDYSLSFWGSNYRFGVSVLGTQGNLVVGYARHLSSRGWASALLPKVPVGPNQRFTPYRLMLEGFCSRYCAGSGPWDDVENRYLGFKFLIKGKFHYGWARLNVTISGRTVSPVLTGYAYETVPNKPLVTGKTKGPDNGTRQPDAPTTLGRLALGRK
jgi:hypothetical protein